jgi:hypothetical protein
MTYMIRRRALQLRLGLTILLVGANVCAAAETNLFNGKNFDGWQFFLERKGFNADGNGKVSDFASVQPGGIIEIRPQMNGALITDKDYLNYKLHVEWRWADPGNKRSNSGLFLRVRPPFVWDTVHGEIAAMYIAEIGPAISGDLWVIGGYSESKLTTDPSRSFIPFGTLEGKTVRRHVRIRDAEKPAGEWNTMEVTMDGKSISVTVNGELVNEGTNLVDLPGRIGLESEIGPVQFRNIRLTTLGD